MPKTMFDKIWDAHEVADGLIYIDLHLVHEVTSPQAFDGLRMEGRPVRRPDKTVATADHNVPTDGTPAARMIADDLSRIQVETLERNCAEFDIPIYSLGSDRQGIVHVIGPELGITQPGLTIVCGDSHTSTHGAFGALAFGIGTSEVEHVLATQCLVQRRPKTMRIDYSGELGAGVSAKDLILATIGRLGVSGMVGHAVEYAGDTIRGLSMENRMTICNMTIEGGGRAGMIAPDETTFEWVSGRPGAPEDFDAAVAAWRELADRRGRRVRHRGRCRRRGHLADGHVGHQSRHGHPGHRCGSRSRGLGRGRGRPRGRRTSARLHGAGARHADHRHRARPRVHRLVHELADSGPARGGVDAGSDRLRLAVSAGEALPADLGERWQSAAGVDVLDGIGSTEMLQTFLSNRPGDIRYGTDRQAGARLRRSRSSMSTARAVADGEIGELARARTDRRRRLLEPARQEPPHLRRRMDLHRRQVLRDADGYYHYCGRTDDMFKVSGMWVSPFEVEAALASHEAVLEAAVIGKEDADGLIKPKAFIVLRERLCRDEHLIETLRVHVKERAGPWKYPRWIDIRPDLPRTATGKDSAVQAAGIRHLGS